MSSTNKRPTYTSVDVNLSNDVAHRQRMATTINSILSGKQNNVLDITLSPNVTSTVITDSRLTPYSHLSLTPVTADAMTAYRSGVYPSIRAKGSVTLNHASAAATDQQFTMEITG